VSVKFYRAVVVEPLSKILGLTTVYAEGRTQIPKPVRDLLKLCAGNKVVWKEEDNKIIVARQEEKPAA
jgi:AbrB family looped-hinge helix DNA binding protein